MGKKVAVIVVTYNRLNLLKDCIASLRSQTYQDSSIIVINNGSTDDTFQWLSAQKDIIVITQNNLGGAGGFFTGIKYACEHEYEYSWVMDDDVISYPDTLEQLMNQIKPEIGFLCSNVLDVDEKPCNVPKVSISLSDKTGELVWGEYLLTGLLRVDIASFVSVCFNNERAFELGLPFKEYFIWGDDTEYTSRISVKYPSYMVIDSVVIHKRKIQGILSIHTEIEKNRIKNYFYYYRNRIHNKRSFKLKFLHWGYCFCEALGLFFRGNIYKSYIIMKALFSALIFAPKIVYPSK